MCGIAGVLHHDEGMAVAPHVLRRMADAIQHRGPDGEGFFTAPGVGLAHRRLAIIDPAAGHQPMIDPVTGNVIIFNGEIFNYVELKRQLVALGRSFRTDSDTEVLLQAYAEWGEECLQRLNGMWAFAIWDSRHRRLFLARDRLGIKPLHYCTHGGSVAFASEIKSLFAFGLPRCPDPETLDLYLCLGYLPAPYSFFRHIQKLKPGHYAIATRSGVNVTKYWDIPVRDESQFRTDADAVCEEFASILRDAVRIQMRSDVSFGAFLSGGLDSASIASLMADHSNVPVETFTIGFREPAFDERRLARMVAAHAHSNHHEYVVTPDHLPAMLDRVATHYDEPFGDSSALAVGHVARFAAEHVKMVLTGDGGDEVLSGYPAYLAEKLTGHYQAAPAGARWLAQGILAQITRHTRGRLRYAANRYQRLALTAEMPFQQRLLSKASWLAEEGRRSLLTTQRYHCAEDALQELMAPCPYRDPFYRLMYFHLKVSLPDDMLTKVDRMTMASSLEARVPFLDHRVVELLSQVDKRVKLPGLSRKSILRRTVAKNLPSPLLRASKRGFVVPLSAWFRADDWNHLLTRISAEDLGLSATALTHILQEHRSGHADHGNLLWMLLVLQRVMTTN